MEENLHAGTEGSFQDFQYTQITRGDRGLHRTRHDRFCSKRCAQEANHFIITSLSTSLSFYTRIINLKANGLQIRNAAADALFLLTQEESLKPIDWGSPTKYTKQALSAIREAIGVT